MTAYRHWRIYCTANNDAWKSVQLGEVQWRLTAGGAKTDPIALGGTITASQFIGASRPELVNDGDFTSAWATDGTGGGGIPASLMFDFGAAHAYSFAEVAMAPRTNGGASLIYAPSAFTIDGSDDGVTWTNVISESGIPASGWTENTFNTYALPTSPPVDTIGGNRRQLFLM